MKTDPRVRDTPRTCKVLVSNEAMIGETRAIQHPAKMTAFGADVPTA